MSDRDQRQVHDPEAVPLLAPGASTWLGIAALVLAVAIVLHALLPRYEFVQVGGDTISVLVFDRWTGRFQRITYNEDGQPVATPVVRPF